MASQFYGLIQGQAGEATRKGSKRSGYRAWAQNDTTRIAINLWHSERDDRDYGEIAINGSTLSYSGETIFSTEPLDLNALMEFADIEEVRELLDKAGLALSQASALAHRMTKHERELAESEKITR